MPAKSRLLLVGPLAGSGVFAKRDSQYLEKIRRLVRELGLEERVIVSPRFVEEPEAIIKAADVYLMPSEREALGTPVLESLACGVPGS